MSPAGVGAAGRRRRDRLGALAEVVSALALVVWVGGATALGAYAARIVFRELPRAEAAPTMNAIFRSFDGAIAVALVLLAIGTLVRLWARGLRRGADRLALLAAALLLALGLGDVAYLHPRIDELYQAGRTLEPAFAALHKRSSRAVQLEALLTAVLLGAHALARRGGDEERA